MHLTPTELERLTIFTAAELARRYVAQGIRLAHPEAVALLADELLTFARHGHSHSEIVSHASTLLRADQVEPGVAHMLKTFSVEVSMAEGTKLVTVFDPIAPAPGDPIPGEVIPAQGEIEINAGREAITLSVLNTGDRTIQVRSHAHFFEVNPALQFDRAAAFGMRLDRPSGGGERFDPGIEKHVVLVPYGGKRVVHGFAGLTEGPVDGGLETAIHAATQRGYMR
ncbi:urease subunit beta [Salipiger sp. 1_MG-2023]|uniref:urease subunit beta n=1 Tax=Salipiger sp. 1_MG-2023 TaxID=3062665 RepID=UPI0026E14845|nr:urease subunit beta [Salipiger sp. 1_MG-2023]MDO6587433.1 urease subunit beta [Salipiger sp. 1_MG-2023]